MSIKLLCHYVYVSYSCFFMICGLSSNKVEIAIDISLLLHFCHTFHYTLIVSPLCQPLLQRNHLMSPLLVLSFLQVPLSNIVIKSSNVTQ